MSFYWTLYVYFFCPNVNNKLTYTKLEQTGKLEQYRETYLVPIMGYTWKKNLDIDNIYVCACNKFLKNHDFKKQNVTKK